MRKFLLISIAVAILFGVLLLLNHFEIIGGPSSEMQSLRETERTLPLRNPSHRQEEDKGCYRTFKGGTRCSRSITYYYESDGGPSWDDIQKAVSERGWKTLRSLETPTGPIHAVWNDDASNPICLTYFDEPNSSNITLRSKTDDRCSDIANGPWDKL